MLEFGIAIQHFIEPVFDFFKPDQNGENGLAPLLAFLMLLMALVLMFHAYLWNIVPGKRSLSKASRLLLGINTREDFVARFNEIDSALSSTKVLSHGWSEFIETLVPPDENVKIYRNTARPALYLNMAEVEGALRLRKMHFWSGLFVGLGLLLTFIGLVAALNFAGQGIKNGQLENSIKDLLGAASLKFWTSVSGLGCSILLKVFYERQRSSVSKLVEKINSSLERGLLFVTPEALAVEHLREAREQTGAMKRFSTDLAVSLTTALQPVNDSLKDIGQRITGGIGDAIKDAAGSEMNALSRNLSGIVESLNNSRTEMDGMAATIRTAITEAAESLRTASNQASTDVSNQLKEIMASVAEESKKQAQAFDASMQRLSGIVDQAGDDAGGKIAGAAKLLADGMNGVSDGVKDSATTMAEKMNQLSAVLQTIEERMKNHIQAMEALTGKTQETEKAMGATSKSLTEAASPVAQASNRLATTAEQLNASMQTISAVITNSQQSLAQLATKMQDTQQTLQNAWQGYDNRFTAVDDSLAKAVHGIVENVKHNVQSFENFVKQIDEGLSQSIRAFGQNVTALNETAEDFEKASSDLLKSVNKMTGEKAA